MILKRYTQRPVQPLAYGYYWGTALALCVAGLTVSLYLAVSHYWIHTDINYQSFCAISKSINCDTVSQSPFAVWWGLPLAVWGVVAYTLILTLILFSFIPSIGQPRVWTIIFAAAFGCSLASIGFAGISGLIIGSWCILCIAAYCINFILAYTSWVARRRFGAEGLFIGLTKDLRFLWDKIIWSGPVFGILGAGLVIAILVFPDYWEVAPLDRSVNIRAGMTDDSNPWIGAEEPALEIVEFTDYQCFQCRKMHRHLLQLLARYPDKIRVIQRHFPMDHEYNPVVSEPFHVGSGRMAILAIHAAYQGKFAEMNDWLFYKAGSKPESISLSEAAAATGLDFGQLSAALQHAPYRLLLKRDIHEGLRLGVVGTPSYVIDGKVYEGNLPAEALRPLLGATVPN